MDSKKIYGVIAVVFVLTYAYNLYWFLKVLIGRMYVIDVFFFIRYITVFAGITGVIIFIASKFKRSNLLRMIMCFEIMSFPFVAFWYFQFLVIGIGPAHIMPALNWTFIAGCLVNFSLIASSVIGLRMLSFNKVAKLSYTNDDMIYAATFSPAPAGLRFVNRLLDGLMMLYILFNNAGVIFDVFKYSDEVRPELLLLLEIPFLICYYLILEGIFNTSAGKCATGTVIVNENAARPGFAKILGRTFCRLIPFEAFSFFSAGARGWHDTMTNTYVVESINKEDALMDDIILDAELNTTA